MKEKCSLRPLLIMLISRFHCQWDHQERTCCIIHHNLDTKIRWIHRFIYFHCSEIAFPLYIGILIPADIWLYRFQNVKIIMVGSFNHIYNANGIKIYQRTMS